MFEHYTLIWKSFITSIITLRA